ncbi:MAG TPA: hypothetical protein VGR22_04855 [Thermomicrobiales bacterium]|nr:hypothetical protein [Thermomicrobiales bacterium]
MEQARNTSKIELKRETMEQSMADLRLSLTAAWAWSQLLERRSQQGIPPTSEHVDRAAGAISTACEEMVRTLHDLESTYKT